MDKDSPKVVIDTNLLVRFLTDDEPNKAKAVDTLLLKAGRNELKILIPNVVIAELVWVLESFYRMTPEEIINLIEAILNTPGAEIQDKSIIAATLKLYGSKNIDFIDAWIIAFAKNKNVKTIYTFDKKHFRDIGEVEAMSP